MFMVNKQRFGLTVDLDIRARWLDIVLQGLLDHSR